ncbi:hypothetical protein, partial [Kitasatospora sp. NPDC002965]|uniref:hypothetical protein n=1 Tax=Kitasatospora sp. NPDC002965 TaxID=3154775 RepID=UPI0033BCD34B
MLPLPDHLTAGLRDRDPVRRYRTAEEALDAVSAYLDQIQAEAAHALVAAHGGNKSAAGRELGYGSQQAFDKW